jgi:NADPH:quinone reductase-like Zn-dependent oxidoreductase
LQLSAGLSAFLRRSSCNWLTFLRGHSPDVKFPRVLGVEAVGRVEESPGGEFKKDDIVATAMGGMGRQFDGGYAEYTCVPVSLETSKHVQLQHPYRSIRPFPRAC